VRTRWPQCHAARAANFYVAWVGRIGSKSSHDRGCEVLIYKFNSTLDPIKNLIIPCWQHLPRGRIKTKNKKIRCFDIHHHLKLRLINKKRLGVKKGAPVAVVAPMVDQRPVERFQKVA
jgi:hypothetical protein